MRLLFLPGNLVANLLGLDKDSDSRMLLRMFINSIFWGAIATYILVLLML